MLRQIWMEKTDRFELNAVVALSKIVLGNALGDYLGSRLSVVSVIGVTVFEALGYQLRVSRPQWQPFHHFKILSLIRGFRVAILAHLIRWGCGRAKGWGLLFACWHAYTLSIDVGNIAFWSLWSDQHQNILDQFFDFPEYPLSQLDETPCPIGHGVFF